MPHAAVNSHGTNMVAGYTGVYKSDFHNFTASLVHITLLWSVFLMESVLTDVPSTLWQIIDNRALHKRSMYTDAPSLASPICCSGLGISISTCEKCFLYSGLEDCTCRYAGRAYMISLSHKYRRFNSNQHCSASRTQSPFVPYVSQALCFFQYAKWLSQWQQL